LSLIDEYLDHDDLSHLQDQEKAFTVVSKETIRRLSPRKPISLSPEHTLQEAIHLMQDKRIGAVIIAEKKVPVGIFTERDLLFKVLKTNPDLNQAKLREYMTPDPVTLFIEDKIAFALNQMTLGGFRHLPVVDEKGHLTGIVSVKDIVEYLAGLVPEEVYNLRPTPLRSGFQTAEGG